MAEGGNSNFVSKLDLNASNVEAAWKRFKSQFSIFYIAKQLGEKSEEEQIANMLLLMGSDVVPIYERFQFATTGTDNRKTLENVKNKFDAHFRPAKSVIFERLKFNKTVQQPGQSIHAFVTQLLIQSDECEYGEMRDDLVRDRIVVGVHDDGLRDHLLTIENLNLDTCIRRAKQYASQREGVSNYLKGNSVVADNLDTVSIKKGDSLNRAVPKHQLQRKDVSIVIRNIIRGTVALHKEPRATNVKKWAIGQKVWHVEEELHRENKFQFKRLKMR